MSGKLYDITGRLLAAISLDVPFSVGNLTLTAKLPSSDTLSLSQVSITNNLDKQHQHAVEAHANELHHRKQDLEEVEKEIQALMLRAQEGGDDAEEVGQDLVVQLGIKGTHAKRIKELEATVTVVVKYKEKHIGTSAVLRNGVYASLSWFPTPVVWCLPAEEKEEERVVEMETRRWHGKGEELQLSGACASCGNYSSSYLATFVLQDDRKYWANPSSQNGTKLSNTFTVTLAAPSMVKKVTITWGSEGQPALFAVCGGALQTPRNPRHNGVEEIELNLEESAVKMTHVVLSLVGLAGSYQTISRVQVFGCPAPV